MRYIKKSLKNRIEEMRSRWFNDQLNEGESMEFDSIVDEIVIEARRTRSSFVPDKEKPEAYLLDLFERFIENLVIRFFKKNPEHYKAANHEVQKRNIMFTETSVFCEWMNYARQITRIIILGDGTKRYDRRKEVVLYLEKFISSKDKHLDLNFKWAKARHDEMLGESGTHKQKDFLKKFKKREFLDREAFRLMDFSKLDPQDIPQGIGNEPGFFFKDSAAIKAAEQCALDNGLGYDPDYFKNKRKDLLLTKAEAKSLINQWGKGNYQDKYKTKENLIKAIEEDLIGKPLEMLDAEIAKTRSQKSNLQCYLNVFLFRRLTDLHKDLKRRQRLAEFKRKERYQEEKNSSVSNKSDSEKFQELHMLVKSKLTKKQIEIFELYFSDGYSAAEIARKNGTSRQNISQIIKRIVKNLTDINKTN